MAKSVDIVVVAMRMGNHTDPGLDYKILDRGFKADYSMFNSFLSMGPRQIRCESCLIRPHNTQTGAAPYESLMVADVGDVSINVFNLGANIDIIQQHVANIVKTGCKPLIMGGDHTISYPILRAMKVC